MRIPYGRRWRTVITSVAVGISACSSEPGAPPTDRLDVGTQGETALVSLAHSALVDGRVAVAVRAQSSSGPVAALQITLHYDAAAVTFAGYQVPRALGGLITTRLVAPGELRVAALASAGLPVDALVLEFTVRQAGALSTLRLGEEGTIAATTTGRRLRVRIAAGLSEDGALQPGAAVQLTHAEWATRLASWSAATPRPAAFQAGDRVYGDVNFSGAIDLLDALLIADVAVGNRAPLTGDAFEVANVVPANVADGVIATLPDSCRPGRECTLSAPFTELGAGLVDLLDALAVANEAVGTDQPVPGSAVPTGTAFASLAAEVLHTCGLTAAGAAYCWGYNAYGQLGDGSTTSRLTPVAVSLPAGVTFARLAAGLEQTCGLTAAGTAYCWGRNQFGGLGDGSTTQRLTPVAVSLPAGVTFTSLAMGALHTCGLTAAGAAYCWGDNFEGQLGDGSTNQRLTPVAVSLPAGVTFTSLAARESHTCGRTAAGAAYCWGSNSQGQLGDGSMTSRFTPVAVSLPAGVTLATLAAGTYHTCGRTAAGAAYCWGGNTEGALGDGSTTLRLTPVPVSLPIGVTLASLAAGGYHTCGLTAAGAAYCWGWNIFGALGDGKMTSRLTPVAVSVPTGVTLASLAAGGYHTCGLTVAGAAYCWGRNQYGQLGDGTTTQRLTPVPVTMPPG